MATMFACRGPDFSSAEGFWLISVFLGWLIGFALIWVNLVLILTARKSPKFKYRNVLFMSAYIVLALAVVWLGFGNIAGGFVVQFVLPVLQGLAIGLPLMVMGHFAYLVVVWRRSRKAVAEIPASQEPDENQATVC